MVPMVRRLPPWTPAVLSGQVVDGIHAASRVIGGRPSPASRCSMTVSASDVVSNGSSLTHGAGISGVAVDVLAAERDQVQHGHGVGPVREPVDPEQPGLGAPQEHLQPVAGARWLTVEGRLRRNHVAVALHRPRFTRAFRRVGLCVLQPLGVGRRPVRARCRARQQQCCVVQSQRVNRRVGLGLVGRVLQRPGDARPARGVRCPRRARHGVRAPNVAREEDGVAGLQPDHLLGNSTTTARVRVQRLLDSSGRARRWRSGQPDRGSSPTARRRRAARCLRDDDCPSVRLPRPP